MAKETYNTGRVVGWSTYEEFLKQNPDIDPSIVTALVYQTMVTYGAASLVDLPINRENWSGDVLLTQTVAVPGAIWGVTPIVGLNYTAYQQDNTVPDKGKIERGVSNIFSCYVSDQNGKNASNATSETGYITFCAYPEILECGLSSIPLLIRGLGAEAITSGNGYFGPEGLVFAGNGFGAKGASSNYLRCLPKTDPEKYVDMDPVIDMRTTNPKSYYDTGRYSKAPEEIDVKSIQPLNSDAGVIAVYNKNNSSLSPALYGVLLPSDSKGLTKIYPLDIVAPGTVKLFDIGDVGSPIKSVNEAQAVIQNFEESVPYNRGFYRSRPDVVVYEHDLESTIEPFPPVSLDEIRNINGFYTYNTKYCYFGLAGDGNASPSPDELKKQSWVICLQGEVGFVSQKFIDSFCVPLTDLIKNVDKFKDNEGVEQLSGYWYNVPENERKNYSAFIISVYDTFTETSQQYSCRLVDNRTGGVSSCSYGETRLQTTKGDVGLDFTHGSTGSGSSRKYAEEVLKFGGTWWNQENYWGDSNGAVLFSTSLDSSYYHTRLFEMKTPFVSFYQPKAFGPQVSEKFSGDWISWINSVPMSSLLKLTGQTFDSLSIHEDYRQLSVLEFMMKATVRYLDKPDNNSNIKGDAGNIHYNYIFPRQQLESIFNGNSFSLDIRDREHPGLRVTVPGQGDSFFRMRKWVFDLWDSNNSHLDEKDSWVDFWTNYDEVVKREDSAIWAAFGQSGHKEAYAISLVDSDGIQLNTQGNSDTILADFLVWKDLLNALNHNKSIDLLGPALRSLKELSGISLNLTPDSNTWYSEMQLDVFGYMSSGVIKTAVTYATLTRIVKANRLLVGSDSGNNWYVGFRVSNTQILRGLVETLSESATSEAGANTLKVLVNSHISYASTEGGSDNGKPTSNETAAVTCYIDITEGENYGRGTLFCRNNGHITYASTTSNICSLVLSNEVSISYQSGGGNW